MSVPRPRLSFLLGITGILATLPAQGALRSPREALGQDIGADYFLASYTQLRQYWTELSKTSDRIQIEEIGKSGYGQPMIMAVISSPRNLARKEELRRTAATLARAEGIDDTRARALAQEGRAVVWIDGGLHATESVAAQNILELVWRLVSGNDPETLRILDQVVVLVCPVNPDGLEMVASGYMASRKLGQIPVLYQRYAGHDNNRDYYMGNCVETLAVNRIFYQHWFPQIIYNHHQTAPRGTVIYTPPFRDPHNYLVDARIVRGIDLVAAHMNSRFAAEGKPGVISRSGAPYSGWWNGGLRTTAYFHNVIGILTEVFGSPTPTTLRAGLDRRLASGDYPMPITTQRWHARQTIEYLQTANRAILDYASRYREELLWNIYAMARDAIRAGQEDRWTITPKRVAAVRAAQGRNESAPAEAGEDGADSRPASAPARDPFQDPAARDPRGYILAADQPDFAAATRFVQALQQAGVKVLRATAPFEVGGKRFPAESWVIRCDQPYRAHVLDLFEPQDHPHDFKDGEPVRPYDAAGWTLALQMGVRFERVLDGFTGPFATVEGTAALPRSSVPDRAREFLLGRGDSASWQTINGLLQAGQPVACLEQPVQAGDVRWPIGTFVVPAGELLEIAAATGARVTAVPASAPALAVTPLRIPRVGLFDVWGGDMATGWTEYVLKELRFPCQLVFGSDIEAGGLRERFDVLLFATGLPRPESERPERGEGGDAAPAPARPEAFSKEDLAKVLAAMPKFLDVTRAEDRRVKISREKGVPALRTFVEAGGVLLALGGQSPAAAALFDLPVRTGTFAPDDKGERPTKRAEFFVPGSLLRVNVTTTDPLGLGVEPELAAMFRSNPVLTVLGGDAARGKPAVTTIARYADRDVLASGWIVGEEFVRGRAAVVSAAVGKGHVVLYGPDVIYRGQPWASFKLVANGILLGARTGP